MFAPIRTAARPCPASRRSAAAARGRSWARSTARESTFPGSQSTDAPRPEAAGACLSAERADDIVDDGARLLDADGQPDEPGRDPDRGEPCLVELVVAHQRGLLDQRLDPAQARRD